MRRLISLGLEVEDGGEVLYAFAKEVLRETLDLEGVSVHRRAAHLEDLFLRLTGRELRDE